ncbi:stage II sporulation protein D [Natranaerobius thermophilus]|uniref:Stage II sporulation protein D n=1 Tax=Natranaerobius thermophilus (strain ATCC BAA-1301 / DSM 18059 / JW/NM-WN-LF) TaxID=457570 RepID=B2A3F7_NATTJ|nr:stage II sporulation protein D [Natranaerobius thermophilus]ACB86386.1 stage II sporulation protein D [Natranaerobius thermophilus JW/NM-WN-LF]
MVKKKKNELQKILIVGAAIGAILLMIIMAISSTYYYLADDPEPEEPPELEPLTLDRDDIVVRVYFHEEQEVKELKLEEYLVGVVISEMPPEFDQEALKSQAVVARSYTLSRLNKTGGPGCDNHQEADVCTDPDFCQAHYTKETVENIFGENANKYYDRVKDAVLATKGEIMTYNGDPVPEAPYHSTCGGQTETAGAVWSADFPFLQSVECDYCDHSSYYRAERNLNKKDLEAGFSQAGFEIPVLAAGEMPELQVTKQSETGRIQKANLLGNQLSGHDIRSMFDIPSTNIEWIPEHDSVRVVTKGFGHGVGLCQYGADGMARDGQNYQDIIKYYFEGVKIKDNLYK